MRTRELTWNRSAGLPPQAAAARNRAAAQGTLRRGGHVLGARAAQLAALRQVEGPAAVDHRAVVPHHAVARAPDMAVDDLALRRVLEELLQQHAPLGERQLLHVRGVDAHPKELSLRARVHANERPFGRRYRIHFSLRILLA